MSREFPDEGYDICAEQRDALAAWLQRVSPGAFRAYDNGAELPEQGYYVDTPSGARLHMNPEPE